MIKDFLSERLEQIEEENKDRLEYALRTKAPSGETLPSLNIDGINLIRINKSFFHYQERWNCDTIFDRSLLICNSVNTSDPATHSSKGFTLSLQRVLFKNTLLRIPPNSASSRFLRWRKKCTLRASGTHACRESNYPRRLLWKICISIPFCILFAVVVVWQKLKLGHALYRSSRWHPAESKLQTPRTDQILLHY